MVATVIINEKNGAGEVATDKTSGTIRFKSADNATVDTNNRLTVPVSGSAWSFEKWARLNVAGTFTDITDVEAYTDGSIDYGTGVTLYWKNVASYATPAQVTSASGYTDASTVTSASPMVLGAGPFTAPGDVANYLVMMVQVDSTASPGTLPSEPLTIAYTET